MRCLTVPLKSAGEAERGRDELAPFLEERGHQRAPWLDYRVARARGLDDLGGLKAWSAVDLAVGRKRTARKRWGAITGCQPIEEK